MRSQIKSKRVLLCVRTVSRPAYDLASSVGKVCLGGIGGSDRFVVQRAGHVGSYLG